MKPPKKRNGERGPDKAPRKGSPRLGRKGPIPSMQESPSRAQKAKAVALLSTGETPKKVAEDIGVAERTVYRWLKLPTFAAALDALLEEGRKAAELILKGSATTAANALRTVAASGTQYDGPKVKAAESILAHIGMAPQKEIKVTMDAHVDVSRMSDEDLAAEQARLAKR